jgi:hypothetical protein
MVISIAGSPRYQPTVLGFVARLGHYHHLELLYLGGSMVVLAAHRL